MDAGDPFGYVSYERGHRAAVDSAEVEPDGFASPAHCQVREAPLVVGCLAHEEIYMRNIKLHRRQHSTTLAC